jgi:hypothetical protein
LVQVFKAQLLRLVHHLVHRLGSWAFVFLSYKTQSNLTITASKPHLIYRIYFPGKIHTHIFEDQDGLIVHFLLTAFHEEPIVRNLIKMKIVRLSTLEGFPTVVWIKFLANHTQTRKLPVKTQINFKTAEKVNSG